MIRALLAALVVVAFLGRSPVVAQAELYPMCEIFEPFNPLSFEARGFEVVRLEGDDAVRVYLEARKFGAVIEGSGPPQDIYRLIHEGSAIFTYALVWADGCGYAFQVPYDAHSKPGEVKERAKAQPA